MVPKHGVEGARNIESLEDGESVYYKYSGRLSIIVASAQTGVPLGTIFRGIIPFLIMEIIVLLGLIMFPEVTLFLPDLMVN